MNDLISDALTRIRNASMRRLDTTKLLHSNVVEGVLKVLEAKGYVESFNVVEEERKKFINVVLKYDERGASVITEIKRVSKPGRRVYKGKDEIKRFKLILHFKKILKSEQGISWESLTLSVSYSYIIF